MNSNYLICKSVLYYSSIDEDMFFEWVKRIKCIKGCEGAKDELYLDLVDRPLSYEDMKDLTALLCRYKINMQKLEKFINDDNKMAVRPWIRQIKKGSR